jgi:dolichol-phosphate mannosyltransferase
MYARWREGFQIVIGERVNRAGETAFKRWAAAAFYRLLRWLDASVAHETGNFRMLDRAVVDALLRMPERNRFVRGMISWVGFRKISVPYQRAARFAGTTKYSPGKMLRLATDAITSFSFAPLRLATVAGLAILATALLEEILSLGVAGFSDHPHTVNRTLLIVLYLSGVQLLSIGILGEYIGRIYIEVKQRPLFIVRERCGFAADKQSSGGLSG